MDKEGGGGDEIGDEIPTSLGIYLLLLVSLGMCVWGYFRKKGKNDNWQRVNELVNEGNDDDDDDEGWEGMGIAMSENTRSFSSS